MLRAYIHDDGQNKEARGRGIIASQPQMFKRLLVIGGNGLIGKAVCRAALKRGWNVTSIARQGAPSSLPANLQSVTWVKGSVQEAETIRPHLLNNDIVINCVGTLWESATRSYEKMNYQSMASILDTIKPGNTNLESIGFISATVFDPITKNLLSKYYATKYRAEAKLSEWIQRDGNVSGVVFRPGMVYGSDRLSSYLFAFIYRILTIFASNIFPPPIQVDRLAETVVTSLASSTRGTTVILEPKDL